MNNLPKIKQRMEAISKTISITDAMYKISTSKLHNTQKLLTGHQGFIEELEYLLNNLLVLNQNNYLLKPKLKATKTIYILLTSDRGLVGDYHDLLFKEFKKTINKLNKNEYDIIVIGKKGFNYLIKNKITPLNKEPLSFRDNLSLINFRVLADTILNLYKNSDSKKIVIIYQNFINMVHKEVKYTSILPLEKDVKELRSELTSEYVYEGEKDVIFSTLVHMYLQSLIYGVSIYAKMAEFSSRVVAMKTASDNAKEALEKLTLIHNLARQQKITSEILDIANAKINN